MVKVKSSKSVIVRPRTYFTPNVADLLNKWNNRHRLDRQVMGAIELAYLRGEHAGYLLGYKDAKAKRRNKWARNG